MEHRGRAEFEQDGSQARGAELGPGVGQDRLQDGGSGASMADQVECVGSWVQDVRCKLFLKSEIFASLSCLILPSSRALGVSGLECQSALPV